MTTAAAVTLTPSGVLRALAAALEASPERWPGRDQYRTGADVDGYRDADRLYVLPAAWQAITGRPGAGVLSVLHERGDLAVPDGWRRKGEWVAPAPNWAGKVRTYAVRLAAIAAPAPDPDPGTAAGSPGTAAARGSKTGADRTESGPDRWSSAPEPAPAPEPCPDCDGPAVRTLQGTLTDCPACGLVLTEGCRDRISKQEETAARNATAAAPAVIGLAAQWQAAVIIERNKRYPELYTAWAKAITPVRGELAELAELAAELRARLNAAAKTAAGIADPAVLAAFHGDIGHHLVDRARELLDAIRADQDDDDQDYSDEDDYDDPDDDDQDDDDAAAIAAVTVRPALPAAAPGCGHCGTRPAVARVDTADPAHRYALGGRLPADLCERCGEAIAAAAAGLTYVRLELLADYGTGRGISAPPPPPPPNVYQVREAAPIARPAPLPSIGAARPAAVPPGAAAWFTRADRPRCEIRAAHRISVGVLGNAPPRAAVTVTDGQRSISTCGGRCAERARDILAAENPRRRIAVEAIR